MRQLLPFIALCCGAITPIAQADIEYSGTATIEQRYFLQDPLFPEQQRAQNVCYCIQNEKSRFEIIIRNKMLHKK